MDKLVIVDIDEFPVNPLEKKWNELYPPTPMPSRSQVCDGYSCMWCSRCPKGDNWKVPEEDMEIYENYQEEVRQFLKKSGSIK